MLAALSASACAEFACVRSQYDGFEVPVATRRNRRPDVTTPTILQNFRNTFNTGASTEQTAGDATATMPSRVDGSIEERALPYTIVAKNS